jgi:hypothetical protein
VWMFLITGAGSESTKLALSCVIIRRIAEVSFHQEALLIPVISTHSQHMFLLGSKHPVQYRPMQLEQRDNFISMGPPASFPQGPFKMSDLITSHVLLQVSQEIISEVLKALSMLESSGSSGTHAHKKGERVSSPPCLTTCSTACDR